MPGVRCFFAQFTIYLLTTLEKCFNTSPSNFYGGHCSLFSFSLRSLPYKYQNGSWPLRRRWFSEICSQTPSPGAPTIRSHSPLTKMHFSQFKTVSFLHAFIPWLFHFKFHKLCFFLSFIRWFCINLVLPHLRTCFWCCTWSGFLFLFQVFSIPPYRLSLHKSQFCD